MSHKHQRLLESIFSEPVSGNIQWREVESLLHHLGAEINSVRGGRVHVFLNKIEGVLHRPHHSHAMGKQEVRHLREYLASAGITLAAYEAERNERPE